MITIEYLINVFIEYIILKFGILESIISNQGAVFISAF